MADAPCYTTSDVLDALNVITRGRVVTDWKDVIAGKNPYVVMKTSQIPGKSIIEIPGLIFGDPDQPVKKVGVGMTLTESVIELASSMRLDVLVMHHPVAEAASSGGVPFGHYLPLYGLALIELHEAFHGLHPGLAFLHGHRPVQTMTSFGGIPGNVLHVGRALDEVKTVSDILMRLESYMGYGAELELLQHERRIREAAMMNETTAANAALLLHGEADRPVRHILHFFPHTGFSEKHLQQALETYPETDTVIVSISRVRNDHPLVQEAKRRDIAFLAGNPHSVEILENGLPLAFALQFLLPGLEVYVMRERVTATPLHQTGNALIQMYGETMARQFLLPNPASNTVMS
jgi:hypothetical protein